MIYRTSVSAPARSTVKSTDLMFIARLCRISSSLSLSLSLAHITDAMFRRDFNAAVNVRIELQRPIPPDSRACMPRFPIECNELSAAAAAIIVPILRATRREIAAR